MQERINVNFKKPEKGFEEEDITECLRILRLYIKEQKELAFKRFQEKYAF